MDGGGGLVLQAVQGPRDRRACGIFMRQHIIQYGWILSGHKTGSDKRYSWEAGFINNFACHSKDLGLCCERIGEPRNYYKEGELIQ